MRKRESKVEKQEEKGTSKRRSKKLGKWERKRANMKFEKCSIPQAGALVVLWLKGKKKAVAKRKGPSCN